MPGLAKTDNFMLGTATVMVGPQADLMTLDPATHSIGLVKNFVMTSEPSYVELTQGVKNTIVHSTMTANPVRCTMEAYEYTARNLAYALALNNPESFTGSVVETQLAAPVTAGSPAPTTMTLDDATGFSVGDYILIRKDNEDDFLIRKITNIATNVVTVSESLPPLAVDTYVAKANTLGVGSKEDQPYYAAKIAGKLANGQPVVIYIPKMRIIRGFNFGFQSEDYGNMPLEFTVYDLVATDPNYAEFDGDQARIFKL